MRREFTESVGIIEEITGKPVRALAYPAGSYNDTVLQIVPEFFDFAYTTKSPNSTPEHTPYTVPRHYIARGYEDFHLKLQSLGAQIELVSSERELQKFKLKIS